MQAICTAAERVPGLHAHLDLDVFAHTHRVTDCFSLKGKNVLQRQHSRVYLPLERIVSPVGAYLIIF